ncbi:MAG: PKD domain-containing protein, partial [Solirubrobacteraceae bacterium]
MALTALAAMLAAPAGAVVVQLPSGQRVGVMVPPGVPPPSGVVTTGPSQPPATTRSPPPTYTPSDAVVINQYGGPVLHTVAPYLVFWDPADAIPASSEALLERYLTDVSTPGTAAEDVFGGLRQYYDSSGYAAAGLSFSTSGQALLDTEAYPTSGCNIPMGYNECLTDHQVQVELNRLLAQDSLPTGTGAQAPVYVVVLPQDVDECGAGTLGCADSSFCSYHSSYDSGPGTTLYVMLPFAVFNFGPKGCQSDGLTTVQSPNDDQTDEIIDDLSHELSETITDPTGEAWYSQYGQEVGDNCEQTGAFNPTESDDGPSNPNAYLPTLGGDADAGTLYDQLIAGDEYYTQTEWSNGELGCEAQPAGAQLAQLAASLDAPSIVAVGAPVDLDPSASTAHAGFGSATWGFGDGSSAFTIGTPTAQTHVYAQAGTYTATLTLVDADGDVAATTSQIEVVAPPQAAFTAPASAQPGAAVTFDAGASSDPDPGGSIVSYAWNWDDGTADQTVADPQVQHVYSTPGSYTVSLTVTDADGIASAPVRHTVIVTGPPTAAFSATSSLALVGHPVTFDADASSDPNAGGSLSSYAWSFGDGATGTGLKLQHTYASAGSYVVTLTVTDSSGSVSSVDARTIRVLALPIAAFTAPAVSVAGASTRFDAGGSHDPNGGAISGYSWRFGDGSSGSGAQPRHVYRRAGSYAVTLTVTDSYGVSATVTRTVVVAAPGRIISVAAQLRRAQRWLLVSVSEPGRLRFGRHSRKLSRAGTARFVLHLALARLRRLDAGVRVRLRVTIVYDPRYGRPLRVTRRITLRRAG